MELGYFGNIWVRQNNLLKAGESIQGHTHKFDHVSLLVSGRVRVTVEGHEPKEFTAPTFIVIKKEFKHKFEALSDDVCWYCVYAMRDIDGDVTDVYSNTNSPYMGTIESSDNSARLLELERKTTEHDE